MRSAQRFFRDILASLVLALPALTGAHAARAADYVLVTGPDYPPYADQNLPDGGLATRIVKQAFEKAGRTVDIRFLPWSRGFAAVRDGKADATFPYAPSAQRLEIMQASAPIFMLENRAWSASDRPVAWQTPTDLTGKRLCLPLGYTPSKPIQTMLDQGALQLIQPRNMDDCVRMVQGHRADFTTDDPAVIRSVMARAHIDLAESPKPLEIRPLVLLATKDDPKGAALLADFNEGLRRMKADGSYARTVRNWPGS